MVKTIAESLTEMKKEAGLSNRKLADLSGVPEGTVNKILSGNTANPSVESVEAMVRAMGRSMDEIFGEPETPSEVQNAVIDHYALLIESYRDQIAHYKDQVNNMRANHRESEQSHKEQLSNHRKGLWFLLILVVALVIFIGYLFIDAAHGNWGLIQYPIK